MAIDLGLSLRMAERLASAAQRFTSSSQSEVLLWPVNEAAVAGFTIDEFDVGPRVLPSPDGPGLNTILPMVTGSLFADIDAKAAFWQRARLLPPARYSMPPVFSTEATLDIASMIQAFRLAYTNLQEIWSAGAAAAIAARTQAALCRRYRGIPHAREPLGPYCL